VALATGTQLGRYTVLKPLVSGGLAEVLLARAHGMGGFQHHVVIKAIHGMDPTFVKAFVDEARLAASLHHHHIVQVHDVGREGDDYFFAMEYVHGENLRKLLTKVARAHQLVPLDQVITIGLAVAAGLHYAHQQNIVHRDVTPANILIGYDGNVKVTDFGIAKALMQSSEMTKSGTMRGKVAYMAPEQCLGRSAVRSIAGATSSRSASCSTSSARRAGCSKATPISW
jgi:eukaryotic-like serine/threonine-protein kinase